MKMANGYYCSICQSHIKNGKKQQPPDTLDPHIVGELARMDCCMHVYHRQCLERQVASATGAGTVACSQCR